MSLLSPRFSTQKARFIQFFQIFKSVSLILDLPKLGSNKSSLYMMQENLYPFDDSSDVFLNIVINFYMRRNGQIISEDIMGLAESLDSDGYMLASMVMKAKPDDLVDMIAFSENILNKITTLNPLHGGNSTPFAFIKLVIIII